MVQLLVDNFGGDARDRQPGRPASDVELYHVDARLSKGLDDIGSFRPGKLLLLLKYCLEAIWLRLRYGVRNFYFMPAAPHRSALYRDWLVMTLCRPFFKRIIYHWEAAHLGEWLQTEARPWERAVSKILLYRPDLSIVLGEFNRRDAEAVQSRNTVVVPNGIPDPCPEFAQDLLPRRLERIQARQKLARGEPVVAANSGDDVRVFKVLFMSMCYSEKGLFDAVEAVALANRKLQGTPFRIKLTVAGAFYVDAEKQQFDNRIAQPDLCENGVPAVEYVGFAAGEVKNRLLRESDCLCFPTWYSAEAFAVILVEALAYGMMVVTTTWRANPECLPAGYEGLVAPKSPTELAARLVRFTTADYDPALRARFLEHYTVQRFVSKIKAALKAL